MGIQDILNKFGKRDSQFKQAQRDQEIMDTLAKRKKTPNERDLERRLEEKRQEQITIELRKMQDEERKGILKSKMMTKENMFNKEEGRNILKQKSMFGEGRGSNLFFNKAVNMNG